MGTETSRRWRGKAAGVGLVAAGALTGGVLASTLSASAADSSSTTSPTAYSYAAPMQQGHGGPMGTRHGNPNETVLTGSDASKATAAALKAVPGGTVNRVETDSGDAVYEAHMTKADGTQVTVKVDSSFKVVSVDNGMS
jgi:hypothetical protein